MQPRHLAGAIVFVACVLLVLACGGRVNVPPPPGNNSPPKDITPQKDGGLPKDELPPKDGPKGPPKVETPRDPATEKPDLVWTADQLRKEAKSGPLFRQKYRDKIIEVSGTVFEFDPFSYYEPANTITVQLEAKPAFIYFHMANREPWAKVVPGQPATLRGRVPRDSEFINEPLVQCVVVEPQQSPALQLTADQLCRDARADAKKYNKTYMVVAGEVIGKSTVGPLYLELKGDDQTKVRCQIISKLKFTIDPIQVGQKIKVFGQYVTINPPGLPGAVILDKALPITKDVQ
jgi:hypothetical protein